MLSLGSFGAFLLDLEGSFEGATPEISQQSAFECLRKCLDFDSGVWASGALTASGPDFHSVGLWRQPAQILLDYEALKGENGCFGSLRHHRVGPSVPARAERCRPSSCLSSLATG